MGRLRASPVGRLRTAPMDGLRARPVRWAGPGPVSRLGPGRVAGHPGPDSPGRSDGAPGRPRTGAARRSRARTAAAGPLVPAQRGPAPGGLGPAARRRPARARPRGRTGRRREQPIPDFRPAGPGTALAAPPRGIAPLIWPIRPSAAARTGMDCAELEPRLSGSGAAPATMSFVPQRRGEDPDEHGYGEHRQDGPIAPVHKRADRLAAGQQTVQHTKNERGIICVMDSTPFPRITIRR